MNSKPGASAPYAQLAGDLMGLVRKRLKLDQKEFIDLLNAEMGRTFSRDQPSRWENHRQVPGSDALLAALALVGVRPLEQLTVQSKTQGQREIEDIMRRIAALEDAKKPPV